MLPVVLPAPFSVACLENESPAFAGLSLVGGAGLEPATPCL
jgi:hypothetical protein